MLTIMEPPPTAPEIRPVEIGWSVAIAGSNRSNRMMVALSMFTAQGEQHYFFDSQGAHALAAALDDVAAVLGRAEPSQDVLPPALNAWLRLHTNGDRCSMCQDQAQPCSIPPEDGE